MRRRARKRDAGPDRGQLLLLAGFVLVMMFVVTSLTLSKISGIEADVAREHKAPIADEYEFVRDRLNETMNSLVDTDTTNTSFNDSFENLRSSFSDVENSRGYDLVLELAGPTTPAPKTEGETYVDGSDEYHNVSFDGERDFCGEPFDGTNDGILWIDGFIQGFIAYTYLADNTQHIESTTIYAVNIDSGSNPGC